jgi:hypothetical protein
MKSKKVFFVVLVALAVFGFATISDAACVMYGKVVMAYSNGGSATFWVSPMTTLPTRYVYFTTNNTYFTQLLAGAQNSHFTVYVYGSATACPASTVASGPGGTVTGVYRYSNY